MAEKNISAKYFKKENHIFGIHLSTLKKFNIFWNIFFQTHWQILPAGCNPCKISEMTFFILWNVFPSKWRLYEALVKASAEFSSSPPWYSSPNKIPRSIRFLAWTWGFESVKTNWYCPLKSTVSATDRKTCFKSAPRRRILNGDCKK